MEDEEPNNPSAFPYNDTQENRLRDTGMTLRDYFAAKAMQAIISSEYQCKKMIGTESDNDIEISQTSYRVADAMLKQREL